MPPVTVDPAKVHEFAGPDDFYRWLSEHHNSEDEVWIKVHKLASGLPSITPVEAIDAEPAAREMLERLSEQNRFALAMSGVPVAEPFIPGKKLVIPFGMRRSDLGIIDAAPNIMGHHKVALSPFVNLSQEPLCQPIRQRHEVCFGDRWVARCQDRGSLI